MVHAGHRIFTAYNQPDSTKQRHCNIMEENRYQKHKIKSREQTHIHWGKDGSAALLSFCWTLLYILMMNVVEMCQTHIKTIQHPVSLDLAVNKNTVLEDMLRNSCSLVFLYLRLNIPTCRSERSLRLFLYIYILQHNYM